MINEMPKVSIIIPFNNVESYIEECLKSVLYQTLEDIEVICINDASTDGTREIVNLYAENDKRIKLIDLNSRQGQGYARNRGIEAAKGEYIGFVDSDDFVEENMFELLYNAAKKDDTDITMCQVQEFDDINENYITSDYYSLADLSCFGDKVFNSADTKQFLLDINVALWNKIYKREYLINTGEKFPEGFIYEDLPFFFGTYLPAKKINIVWKILYNYRVNRRNSTMQQFNNKILDRLPMVSLTYEKLKSTPYFEEMKQKIQGWIINDLFHRYTLLKENYHKEFFFLMKRIFINLEIEDIKDPYWSKVYHFQGYLLVMNNTFENFNQKVFNEYLDIHKAEFRIRSEISVSSDLDRRFNLIYEDFDKNYKYTEKLVNDSNENNKHLLEVLSKNVNSQMLELKNDIETKHNNSQINLTELKSELESENKNTQTSIEELKSEFTAMLKLQQEQHEEELVNLQNQITKLEFDLREQMIPPLKKLMKKYLKKPEK
ncbi:MAG: glycosyltransferase family 2 protein [Candidatus Gastranaerophilales bacterium]|nr:glycosyltransferase family 2 protein [Candidatus Gastranaerophilales bacterium]